MADDGTAHSSGRAPGEFFNTGMVVAFDRPCRGRSARRFARCPHAGRRGVGDFPAAVRRDGGVSVWYAPHPLLRHWLGWLERIDDTHWSFHMEPHHVEMLNAIPELCGSTENPS